MSLTPRDLVAGVIKIPSLPEVFMKVSEMINSPNHSAADIGRVLSNDAALSARLLKIVNSVFYGHVSRIDTVSRAVAVIGTRALRELILTTSVIRVFKGIPINLVTMNEFWRHNICCALTARTLAEIRGDQLVERFFMAGLLHDIGSVVIYQNLPELAREAMHSSSVQKIPLDLAEADTIGFDHSMVGAELLRKWKLPENLQEITGFHHRPSMAQHFPNDTALIHIADIVSDTMQMGNPGSSQIPQLDPQAWSLAGIPGETIDSIISEVERQITGPLEYVMKNFSKTNNTFRFVRAEKKA